MAANGSKREIVQENLEQIKERLSQGVTITAIAKSLHMSKQTLYNHLKALLPSEDGQNGLDAIKKTRAPAVAALENSMYNSALGGKVRLKQYVKLKHTEYGENGKKAREWEEIQEVEVEEYIKPDTTAGIFLLKNWGNYMNEPRAMEFRAKELELKEKQVDATVW